MKSKLNRVFALVMLSLTGIIMFQVYWSINAYKVNKRKFDSDIDMTMQHAMDDCKKDYFDSIRVVLLKRLSSETPIKVDTLYERDKSNVWLYIHFANFYTSINEPFRISVSRFDFYRAKIDHKASFNEVLVEASFYIPELMNDFVLLFGMEDMTSKNVKSKLMVHDLYKLAGIHHLPADALKKQDTVVYMRSIYKNTIYELPPNYKRADSLRLRNHLRAELNKAHVFAPFSLNFIDKPGVFGKPNLHYSESGEYSYKYHGFKMFHIAGPEFFARAIFRNPQYVIIKGMAITLALSILLILLSIYCFNYIIKTILQQKKLAELKDDFINNMTHELKTPIATMTVAIEGLQKFNALDDPEKTQRYLQTSRNELVRLNDLVSKVLNIAAFESEKVNLVKEEINVDELVREVITSEKLKTNKVVDISFTNKDIKTVIADKLHFRNVLSNLVDNAIKYSGEQVKIEINCFKGGNDAVFSVKDNGMGIPSGHLKQIFDKFHRVPTGNVHNVKGTGLGLSYVKYIVEAHGGDISVKSEINAGSEFIFSIPINA